MTPRDYMAIQTALDRYAEKNAGYIVIANVPRIMAICGNDLSVAEEQLRRWASRHPEDCDVIEANPLKLKVYMTIRPDKENKSLFQKRKQRRSFTRKKKQEAREWYSMFSEGSP